VIVLVVGFTTIYAISAFHHQRCEFEPRSGVVYSIQHYVIKLIRDLRQFGCFPRVLPVFCINKTDCHDILVTEILLKVALNTTTLLLIIRYVLRCTYFKCQLSLHYTAKFCSPYMSKYAYKIDISFL